ncbi:hypothetical protein [Bacillus sp. FJAT-49736]|uniref:hypothetical protein n=1 Tax=Bacillus sp. FJAT-49736 TaxID=2833582 RepID=UPI001BCA2E7D|nr:hypothetical protein [Bacillus sp. FJAT-49736]MBS4172812.1 hypothetical protein [Bacillus sp. FJAT-49736]
MSFTLLLLIALILSFFSINTIGIHFKSKWCFRSPLTAGGTILVINIILITITALGVLFIPFSTSIFTVLSPVISVFAWVYIRKSFQQPLLKRLYAILIGQSIYVLLFIYFYYQKMNLTPLYPGEDTFMRGFGLLIGMTVSIVAIIIGLITFLIPKVPGNR